MALPLPLPVGLVPMVGVDRGGVGGGGWLVGECALQRGGGAGGVDVEEVPRTEIKCRQYLSLMAKCAHFLSAPFFHSWYDETKVVDNGFFVCVQYTSTFSLVVAPCSEKFGGRMVVRIACHFPNEC